MPPPRPVRRGWHGRLLSIVCVNLEGRAIGPMPWQSQVEATQASARHPGAGLQDRATVVALRWNGLAAEQVDVERSQPPPVPRNQVGVTVARLHWGHGPQSNSHMREDRAVGAVILAAGM